MISASYRGTYFKSISLSTHAFLLQNIDSFSKISTLFCRFIERMHILEKPSLQYVHTLHSAGDIVDGQRN